MTDKRNHKTECDEYQISPGSDSAKRPQSGAFSIYTPDDQYSAEAEAIYAEYCALRVQGVRSGDMTASRDRRRELVDLYDRATGFSISERAHYDRIHENAVNAAMQERTAEVRKLLEGKV